MNERIILAPGLNGAELMKTLALHGVNCFNLRICNAGELAQTALVRSGIIVKEEILGIRDSYAIVAEALQGDPYFKVISYQDIQEITRAIQRMRSLVGDGDEKKVLKDTLLKGTFQEKNTAFLRVYQRYMELLQEKKKTDSISIIRKAAAECKKMDAEFITLKEYPLSPLEKLLLAKLSNTTVHDIGIRELFGKDIQPVKIRSFKNCYGVANEVETILEDIYNGKNLDECTVAVADARTYSQIFFDYAILYNIPMSFGCGIPVTNSNPARLMQLYYQWIKGGLFTGSSIRAMLSSHVFDLSKLCDVLNCTYKDVHNNQFGEVLGRLRLTNDKKVNLERIENFEKAIDETLLIENLSNTKDHERLQYKKQIIPLLKALARELALPAEEFILKYTHLRRGDKTPSDQLLMKLDHSASHSLFDELKAMKQSAGLAIADEEAIQNILKMNIASEGIAEGKLHIVDVTRAFPAMRSNLYIAGLSASNYPGTPRENHLLLDEDLELFGEGAKYLSSDEKITRKISNLKHFIQLGSDLKANIYVSYSGMNVSELKKDNPSSLIYDLCRQMYGTSINPKELGVKIQKIDYFEPAISVVRYIGENYTKGNKLKNHEKVIDRIEVSFSEELEKEWSPSNLGSFFECPCKFMFDKILGFKVEDEDKPFEILSALENGNLAHAILEKVGNANISLDEFLALSEEYFDRFIAEKPPLIPENIPNEKMKFLDMMETAYHMETHRDIVLKEEDVHAFHESGVKIHGLPDRVEKLDDGSCMIVDFKTGKYVKHKENDVESCLQVLLYAYILETQGYHITGSEYRYIQAGSTVSCKYDDEMKAQLSEKLQMFKRYMETCQFPVSENKDDTNNSPCTFCKFDLVCGKDTDEGVESSD